TEQATGRYIKLTYGDVFFYKAADYTIKRQYIGNTYYVFDMSCDVVKVSEGSAVLMGTKNLIKGDILYMRGPVDFKHNVQVPYPVGIVSKVSRDSVYVN